MKIIKGVFHALYDFINIHFFRTFAVIYFFFMDKPELFNTLLHYNGKQFSADFMAGIIVGIVALPLAIAFGIASGVSPEKGIVTAIFAGFIISLLGGTKVQIGGPTGAFIVIIYGIVNNPEYGVSGLIVATIMAGIMLVILGLCKLGAVIKFIPYPIVVGFTAGIALTIFTTQLSDIFGLTQQVTDTAGNIITIPLKTPGDFIGKCVCYCKNISTFNFWNFIMAMLSVLIIAGFPRLLRRVPVFNKIPGSLYGIVIVTFVVLIVKNNYGIDNIDTIGDRFKIQASMPDVEVPDVTWTMIQKKINAHSLYHCHIGCDRVVAFCCRSRWCNRRPPQFQYRTYSPRCCQHGNSTLWRHTCNRSNCPHHD